jgi:hypothetical protein
MWRISMLGASVLVSTLPVGGLHDASRTTICEVSQTVSDRPLMIHLLRRSQALEARGTQTPIARCGVVVGQAV